MTLPSGQLSVVLYEGAGSRGLGALRGDLLPALLDKGYPVSCVRSGGEVSEVWGTTLMVLGRFVEAPPTIAGDGSREVRALFRDIEGLDCDGILELVEGARVEESLASPGAWKPWFPVIDYNRCTNCMQCLSFCLFGVYGTDSEAQIQVQNEDNCKTDCPACSRVCPEVAILFPKYKHGPINGAEVDEDDLRREAMKVDISALLGGDIYAALRDRSAKAKSRFAKERDDDRALKERQRCLTKLQKDLDIPTEVLASLPSPAEIQANARAAQAKAEAARRSHQASGEEEG